VKFWDVVKEVSAQPVRQEAGRLFVLALAGDPEYVSAAREIALGPGSTPERAGAAEPFLFGVSPPYSEADENRLRHADLLVSLPGGPGLTDFRPADTIRLDQAENLPAHVLARRPDLRIAIARRLPGFRSAAAEQLIREVSRVNAEFATISGLSDSIPFLTPLFPAVAGADILVLTKNQILMIFRLAAIYGEHLDVKSRTREILPIIGGAFGWRTLARQVLGLIPGGLGLPARAGIAYSGTYTVGRAAQMAFDQGRRPTRAEMRRIYEDSAQRARETLGRLVARGRGGSPGEPDALPLPAPEALDEEEGPVEPVARRES
jgi:uncharacterized protein (DUF697 family)